MRASLDDIASAVQRTLSAADCRYEDDLDHEGDAAHKVITVRLEKPNGVTLLIQVDTEDERVITHANEQLPVALAVDAIAMKTVDCSAKEFTDNAAAVNECNEGDASGTSPSPRCCSALQVPIPPMPMPMSLSNDNSVKAPRKLSSVRHMRRRSSEGGTSARGSCSSHKSDSKRSSSRSAQRRSSVASSTASLSKLAMDDNNSTAFTDSDDVTPQNITVCRPIFIESHTHVYRAPISDVTALLQQWRQC